MKLIVAIFQPHQLPSVKQALIDAQVYKFTVTNALGTSNRRGYAETFRGVTHEVTLLKCVRLEAAVSEPYVEPTIEAIIKGARTNDQGDGKIFVLDLPECIRIRTGERGNRAI